MKNLRYMKEYDVSCKDIKETNQLLKKYDGMEIKTSFYVGHRSGNYGDETYVKMCVYEVVRT